MRRTCSASSMATGITRSGASLLKAGVVIASFDTGTPGRLNIVFTDANGQVPTSADVNAIARQIRYANSSDAPPASARIDWTVSDGNSGAQGAGAPLTGSGSTTVTLSASNDAPTLTDGALVGLGASYSEDAPSSAFLVQGIVGATGYGDPDATTQQGMALTGVSGRGALAVLDRQRLGWTDVGAVSGSSALLLAPGSWLRYRARQRQRREPRRSPSAPGTAAVAAPRPTARPASPTLASAEAAAPSARPAPSPAPASSRSTTRRCWTRRRAPRSPPSTKTPAFRSGPWARWSLRWSISTCRPGRWTTSATSMPSPSSASP